MKRLLMIGLLLLAPRSASARTWYITPDGTGDVLTIKAGVDSALSGDTVLVACGTYYEYNIRMKPGAVLLSESGEADCATIDAQYLHRVFVCGYCDSGTVIKGFTITRGIPYLGNPGSGGGMFIGSSPGLVIENCIFLDNVTHHGAAVCCEYSSPRFTDCLFLGNYGISEGGGLYCAYNAAPILENCVFANNWAARGGGVWCSVAAAPVLINCTFYGNGGYDAGGGIHCSEFSTPVLENTVIAYSTGGGAIVCEDEASEATLTCCDVYGNQGGDWTGCIAEQLGVSGNISADPRFCDVLSGDFRVEDCSPCLPGYHPDGYVCGGIIGAFGSGCACGAATEPSTWGNIKSMYR